MKKVKSLVVLMLVAIMLFVAVGCNVDRDFSDKTVDGELYPEKTWEMLSAKHTEAVNITMWIPNSATSTMGKGIADLATKFNEAQKAAHADKAINVTVEFQGKSSTLNEKLQAAILAGNNPVISAVGVSSVPLYGERAVDLRNVFTYKELQAQQQGLLQYSLYNDKFVLNPYFPSASNILVYNKTLMAAKGVTLPTAESIIADPDKSTWNWDTFKTAAKAVTDEAADIYGFATASLDPVGMMYQQGGALYNKTVTGIEFDKDTKFKQGLEFWRSLVTEKAMRDPNRANHNTIITSEFFQQKVGMIYTTSSNVAKFTAEAAKGGYEIGALPFPKVSKFFTNQGGSGIIILNNKPQAEQEAAAEFLKWLNQPAQIASMCAVSGYLPLDLLAMEESALKDIYATTPLLKTTAQFMKFGVKASQGKAKAAADKAINDYCKKIWSEPTTTIDDIIKQAIEKVLYEIAANK